jgi:hypothetical protein
MKAARQALDDFLWYISWDHIDHKTLPEALKAWLSFNPRAVGGQYWIFLQMLLLLLRRYPKEVHSVPEKESDVKRVFEVPEGIDWILDYDEFMRCVYPHR